jgi:hypothetical protein
MLATLGACHGAGPRASGSDPSRREGTSTEPRDVSGGRQGVWPGCGAIGGMVRASVVAEMCIPVDSMLWALVARIRDEGYRATPGDLRALLGSGCSGLRAREVLEREGAAWADRPFAEALAMLDEIADPGRGRPRTRPT